MSTETCTVVGMPCDPCGSKASAVDRVTDIDVHPSVGTVTVFGDTAVSTAEMREAVKLAARAGARLV
jgi:hypothetical protein